MKYNIKIEYDGYPEDPREWSNVGTMLCSHRRYKLGDASPSMDPETILLKILQDCNHEVPKENISMKELMSRVDSIPIEKGFVLPLTLYDHSGISMSVGIDRGWDSSHVGYIYITKETMDKENISPENVENVLRGEVNLYDEYLRGEIFYVRVEKEDAVGNHLLDEGCSGFYGTDFDENGLKEFVLSCIEEEEIRQEISEEISSWHGDEEYEFKTKGHDEFQPDFEI